MDVFAKFDHFYDIITGSKSALINAYVSRSIFCYAYEINL